MVLKVGEEFTVKNKLKALLLVLSTTAVTMCTPAPALAQNSLKESVWIYSTMTPNEKGGVTVNLGGLWYPTEELCKAIGPKVVETTKESRSACYEMKSVFILQEKYGKPANTL
jgi:hypothetical protein